MSLNAHDYGQPASFGLCTLLMGQKLARSDIRKAIGIFSLATPFGAILSGCLFRLDRVPRNLCAD